jgi:hypothetical protein
MSDMKHRPAVHRSANVRRDAWDRRTRSDASSKASATTDTNMATNNGLEGESRVVRRTAAWDLPNQSVPPDHFGVRLKSDIRGTSSPTLPGFPVVLHERGSNGAGPEIAFRFTDADGRERTISDRRDPPAGPCIVSYASLLAAGQDADWELGYLATIALCRMLVKERYKGRLALDSVGLDPNGKVVWVKRSDDFRDIVVAVSYVAELSPTGPDSIDLVSEVGAIFYRFLTGRLPVVDELKAASELNLQAPIWVDTICNAAFGGARCGSVAEFLDVLHQHLTEDQREQVTPRLAEWALRSRRLSQPSEDAVAVQLGVALSHLGVAAKQRARRRRLWLPIALATFAALAGLAVALRNMHVI